MDSDTLMNVLTGTFSGPDAAFALQHHNFNDYRRNLGRDDGLLMPRHTTLGRSGGEYKYGHILEYALHMDLPLPKEDTRSVVWGLTRRLTHNDTGLKKFNALTAEEKEAVRCGGSFSREEDKFNLSWFVDFPFLVLGPDLISRDDEAPTYMVFNPRRIDSQSSARVWLVKGTDPIGAVHAEFAKKEISIGIDEYTRQSLRDQNRGLFVYNLTMLMKDLEERLAIRLRARRPIGI